MTHFDRAFNELDLNPTPESLGAFTTQIETLSKMLTFADMKAGIMDCLRKIRRDQKFDDVRNHETMLRLYKLLGAYSENLGLKGIYEQLHHRGHFNTSLKFYLQWGEELAKKRDLAEFGNVLQMARDALTSTLSMTEIESGFRDLVDEYFSGGQAAALFASPDDTLDVFRDVGAGRKMKRRSSVCHLQQVAPVNTAKHAVFGPKTRTKLRSEFIEVPGIFGVSIEEFRYANWKDNFGEDVDAHRRDSGIVHVRHQPTAIDRNAREEVENRMAANFNSRRRPLSPLSEGGADEDEEKRSRIYSPLVPTKDATRPPLRNQTNALAPPTITLSSDTRSSSVKETSYNLDDSADNEKLKVMAAGRNSSEKNNTRSSSISTSSIRTAKSGGGLDLQAENECLEAHAMFSDTVHLGNTEKTMVINDEPTNRTTGTAFTADDFSVLCDPDPTMNITHDRPKKTSGGLNVVFDEAVPVEEQQEVEQMTKVKKEDDSRLSAQSLKTPPTFGDEDDMFDDELLYGHGFGGKMARGAMVTSTPAAGVTIVDLDSYFGNKSEETEKEMVEPTFVVPTGSTFNKLARRKSQAASAAAAAAQAQVAPPPPQQAPQPKPFPLANSSIDCLSDNLGRRLSIGADEIRSISDDAETTGIANRRRSEIIKQGDINPWDETLRRRLMTTVRAPLNMHEFPERAPKLQAFKDCEVGGEVLHIQTMIGQGGYAKVYRAVNEEKKTVAVKYEVPSCSWEVYICDQMRNRLIKDRPDRVKMADWCIMKVMDAYVFSTASLLINEYHEYGTLLEYANVMKDPNWHISCFLLTQMARILKEVHACKIIHGDIKPDNFMITRKIDTNWDKDALMSNDTFVIKVIDWGRAIDMAQLNDQTFKGRAGTEGFDSPEMIDGRSWNFQADYFGFAATMAVVVTGKYAKLTGDHVGDYSLSCDIKRRNVLRGTIMGTINKFLNIESSKSLPDWSETIQQFVDAWEDNYDVTSWRQAIGKFNEVCDIAVANHK